MRAHQSYRPAVECLEDRELLAAGLQAYVTGGNLYILGTAGAESIAVSQINNQISVAGIKIGTSGGQAGSVNAAGISNVFIYSNGGSDVINLATVKINALVFGGAGNDTVVLGSGNDSVVNGGGFDWIYCPYKPASPVVNSASAGDIHQGQSPLCQTGAALAEAIAQGHNFGNDIKYLGDNWYQVKLYGDLATQRVYFDGWTNSADQAESGGEFWTVLMQRARLQAFGINPNMQYTLSQWDAFNAKTGGRLYSIGEALYNFTGNVSSWNNAFNGATPQALQAALAHGDCLVAQSQTAKFVSSDGIVGNHAYAVLSIYNEGGVWKVRLYNPWGIDRDNGATLDALDKSHPAANDGFITLTWQQFTSAANFKGYFDAKRK